MTAPNGKRNPSPRLACTSPQGMKDSASQCMRIAGSPCVHCLGDAAPPVIVMPFLKSCKGELERIREDRCFIATGYQCDVWRMCRAVVRLARHRATLGYDGKTDLLVMDNPFRGFPRDWLRMDKLVDRQGTSSERGVLHCGVPVARPADVGRDRVRSEHCSAVGVDEWSGMAVFREYGLCVCALLVLGAHVRDRHGNAEM